MSFNLTGRFWAVIAIILVVVIIAYGTILLLHLPRNNGIQISLPQTTDAVSQVYIDGAVNNPGYYDLKSGDNLNTIFQAAGGITGSADSGKIVLYVPASGETTAYQKVDINRADSWLLDALPGIGQVLSQRIIDYRQQNGLFKNINELTKVDGISMTTYEKIKDLITVAE